MNLTTTVGLAIRSELLQRGPCTLETMLDRLPQYSWSQLFAAIDHLSRNGELVLRHPTRFGYEVSLGPLPSAAKQAHLRRESEGVVPAGRADHGSPVESENTLA